MSITKEDLDKFEAGIRAIGPTKDSEEQFELINLARKGLECERLERALEVARDGLNEIVRNGCVSDAAMAKLALDKILTGESQKEGEK